MVLDTISLDPLTIDSTWLQDTLCLAADTLVIKFSNSGSAEFDLFINVETSYPEEACLTNDTINCENGFAIRDTLPPEMEWKITIVGLCNSTIINTEASNVEDCVAEQISFENNTFTGNISDTFTFYSREFINVDPQTGAILSNPYQEALGQAVNQLIADQEACPLPVFCNNTPLWCIDTLYDTTLVVVPIRDGGQWLFYPQPDSAITLLDTTLIIQNDSTYLVLADPSANDYNAVLEIYQINYLGDTIPSFPGSLDLQWMEEWREDSIINIVTRLIDTCCTGGLRVQTEILNHASPPVYDCDPFTVVFLEELRTTTNIVSCNDSVYVIEVDIAGGRPPYFLSGVPGTLSNSYFISDPIPIDEAYSFAVGDQDNCEAHVSGDVCPCVGVEAISLPDLILACEPSCSPITGIGSSLVGDSLQFSWSDTLGSFLVFGDSLMVCDTGQIVLTVEESRSGCQANSITQVKRANAIADLSDIDILNCTHPTLSLAGEELSIGEHIVYEWTGPGIDILNQNIPNPTINEDGEYFLTVIDTFYNCQDRDTILITENFFMPIADAGPDLYLNCDSSDLTIGGEFTTNGPNINYKWIGPGFIPSSIERFVLVNIPGLYQLTVTHEISECSDTAFMTVFPYDTIQIEAHTTPSCWNGATGKVIIDEITGGIAPFSYSLNEFFFLASPIIREVAQGTYQLIVRDRENCLGAIQVEVDRIPPLEDQSDFKEIYQFCGSGSLTLDLSPIMGSDSITYRWSTGSTLPTETFTEPGAYWGEVISICETIRKEFEIVNSLDFEDRFQVPTVFSPNNDGNNDSFKALTSLEFSKYEMSIYNRWGQRVFFTETLDDAWSGETNGQQHPSDIYIWVIQGNLLQCDSAENEILLKGDVTLLR